MPKLSITSFSTSDQSRLVATKNLMEIENKKKFQSFLAIFSNFKTFSYTINVIEAAGTFFRRFGVMPL
jgi:hypothetical protein